MFMRAMSVVLCLVTSSLSAEVVTTPPEQPDAAKTYVFFMHGSGLFKSYADSARGKWKDKINAIADKGFVVISEERDKSWDDSEYAFKVAGQVDALMKKGVPAKNIVVSGYSRGSRLSIMVADVLSNSELNYFLLAGCYNRDEFGDDIKGRILSVYDLGDKMFGSCSDAVEGKEGISFKEVDVNTGYGHGMGSTVRDEWFEPMMQWIKG